MTIINDITIKFSEKDLKDLIINYLNQEGYGVTDVNFSVGSKLVGYGLAEHSVNYFEGACAKCRKL